MTKQTVDNVLDLYPAEMQPAATNGHQVDATTAPDVETAERAWAESLAASKQREYAHLVEVLDQPLDRRLIKQRKGFGEDTHGKQKMLNYLEHHVVTRSLNRVFGYGRWSAQTMDVHDFFDPSATDGIPRAVRVTVQLHVSAPGFEHYEPMTKTGYVVVRPTRRGEYSWGAYEMALGNAEAKAFKRCAAQYGDQFGLSLYDGEEDLFAGDTDEEETPTSTKRTSSQASYENDEAAECEECGKAIRGYTNRTTGKTYTTQQLVDLSKKQANGRVLCLDCRRN